MRFNSFIGNNIEYLQFIGDGENYSGKYRKYCLTDVFLREILSSDPEEVDKGTSIVYFIFGKSRCTDPDGNDTVFPKPSSNDSCVLHPETEHARNLRVSEAGYFIGSGDIEYIRLKLR